MPSEQVRGVMVHLTDWTIDRHPMAGTVEESPTGHLIITFVTREPSVTYEPGEWKSYEPPH